MLGGMLAFRPESLTNASDHKIKRNTKESSCPLYRAVNGTPESNLIKVFDLMGGIDKCIGAEDVVIIKPNVQWWNQGASNLSALRTLVNLIMERPGGFHGEVVIAENCHRGKTPWKTSGWVQPFQLNSDIPDVKNMNDLSSYLNRRYGLKFSTIHLINVASGNKRVYGPQNGNGYVYCDGTGGVPLIKCDNRRFGVNSRSTIMTYPIFSSDKGTIVDMKNGIWENGTYTGQPLRFINFSALNYHSMWCGATSSIKNYMGITDLSGGPDPHNGGLLTGKYYNFHSFAFDKWAPGPEPGILGKGIGTFIKTTLKADLNITTAEWVGLSSRTRPPVAHTRAILACTDPVALDYHATKYVLYPNSRIPIHNPDNKTGPLHQYLMECSNTTNGVLNEEEVKVVSYDFRKSSLQKSDDLVVLGEKKWGRNLKDISKYLGLRYLSSFIH